MNKHVCTHTEIDTCKINSIRPVLGRLRKVTQFLSYDLYTICIQVPLLPPPECLFHPSIPHPSSIPLPKSSSAQTLSISLSLSLLLSVLPLDPCAAYLCTSLQTTLKQKSPCAIFS